jgi:hypothetical protein
MIDGFKFHIGSAEVKKHFLERASVHETKASEAETRLGALTQARELLKAQPSVGNTMAYGDTHDALDRAHKVVRYHKYKAEGFRFLASHVPTDEWFAITGGELSEYEFVPLRPYGMGEDLE